MWQHTGSERGWRAGSGALQGAAGLLCTPSSGGRAHLPGTCSSHRCIRPQACHPSASARQGEGEEGAGRLRTAAGRHGEISKGEGRKKEGGKETTGKTGQRPCPPTPLGVAVRPGRSRSQRGTPSPPPLWASHTGAGWPWGCTWCGPCTGESAGGASTRVAPAQPQAKRAPAQTAQGIAPRGHKLGRLVGHAVAASDAGIRAAGWGALSPHKRPCCPRSGRGNS